MIQFEILASGSKGNCTLIHSNNANLMIDCGPTKKYILDACTKVNFDINQLDGVLITHGHKDHIAQIKTFSKFPLYSANQMKEYEIYPLEPFQQTTIKDIDIYPIPLSHDAPNTIGFIFWIDGEKLVYITDTGYIPEKYYQAFYGAEYIIMESNHDITMLMNTNRPMYLKYRIAGDSGHLSNDSCRQVLSQIVTEKTKEVVLAHVSQEANTYQKAFEASSFLLEKFPNLKLRVAKQDEILQGGCL